MKQQVKNMFDQITMPAESARRIQCAMAAKAAGQPAKTAHMARPSIIRAAACFTVILLAGTALNTQVRAAVNEFVKRYVFNDGLVVIAQQEDGTSGVSYTSSIGLYAEVREDGRLYCIANGEDTDITDLASMETPYIFTYTDADAVEHIVIVGGTPENFGVTEFYRESGEEQEGWIGGFSENCQDQTGAAWPWLAAAWSELSIPWPLPAPAE